MYTLPSFTFFGALSLGSIRLAFDMVMIAILPMLALTVLFFQKECQYKKYDKDTNASYKRGRKSFVASSPSHTFYSVQVFDSYDDLSIAVIFYVGLYVAIRIITVLNQ